MRARAVAISILTLAVAVPALADTVRLKNGRVLHAESVRVVGDRVLVQRRGVRLALPLSAIEEIRRDDDDRPRVTPIGGARDLRARRDRARLAPPRPERRPSATAGVNPFELDPASAEYWQERLAWIRDRIATAEFETRRRPSSGWRWRRASALDGAADELAASPRARLAAFRALEVALLAEARRLGIPSRWLDGLRRSAR